MDIEFLKNELKKVVSEKRYNHSIGVMNTAKELARIYGVNEKKVEVAAILHDYTKNFSKDELEKIAMKYFSDEVKDYIKITEILHGYVSAKILKDKFNIEDEEIYNAIKYHTTGRKNMSLIEKIIYISDAIEPQRDYPGVEDIRKLVKKDLNKGILLEANNKIRYLINSNLTIHINTVEMRNDLNSIIKGEKNED